MGAGASSKRWCASAAAGLVALGCSLLSAQSPQFLVTPDTGVILERSATPDIRTVCTRAFPAGLSGYWPLTLDDVRRLERDLPAFLETKVPKNRRPIAASIPIYRQYVGMYRAGRRVVYVNGFASFSEPDRLEWREHVYVVCDGGPTHFGAVFDLETGKFTDFEGNGSM